MQYTCVIRPTLLMTSDAMYVWNHTHCMYDTIGTLYDITYTLADNTPLFVCHGTHSVYDIICIIYYVTHIVCMTTQALYLTWNPLKLPSHPLYSSSQTLCRRHHTYCVRHQRWHMYAIIHIIHDIILTLYDNPYYLWHHMHYIHYIHGIYMTSPLLCMMSHSLCVTWHNDSIYDIKHYMFMTYSPDMSSCTVLWAHNHYVPSEPLCVTLRSVYFWYYPQCTNVMKRSVCMSSQPLYVWHHMHYIWHHIQSLWHHTTVFMTSSPLYLTSYPLYLTSLPLYLSNHTHSLSDITATLCMITHRVYIWYPIHYIYDIIHTMYDNTTVCVFDTTLGICVTSFALEMIFHPLYHTKSQYLWCHIHFRHDLTSTVSDTAPTLSLSSHPLHWYHTNFCMTW